MPKCLLDSGRVVVLEHHDREGVRVDYLGGGMRRHGAVQLGDLERARCARPR